MRRGRSTNVMAQRRILPGEELGIAYVPAVVSLPKAQRLKVHIFHVARGSYLTPRKS